jgi:hypothetical protein
LTETILNNYNKNYRSTASTTDSHVNTSNKWMNMEYAILDLPLQPSMIHCVSASN